MTKKVNLLFVSIAFPPKKDSESLQAAKYFKYLAEKPNFSITVVTSKDPTLFMPIDESLRVYTKGASLILKIGFFENKYINYILRRIFPGILNKPDSKFGFARKWKLVKKKVSNMPDVIYSRSFPLSSALMAYSLQKYYQVPWFLHLSDPWTLNPIHSIDSAKEWNEDAERKCLKAASIVSFTSEKTVTLYKEKYPEWSDKFILMPNVFDSGNENYKAWIKKKKLRVVYTGGLVENRDISWFLKAFDQLRLAHRSIAEDFEVIFAGSMDRRNAVLFSNCKHMEINHVGLLSFQEALNLQNSADLLLLIDTPIDDPSRAVFFPSKLLDYMLAKRRVLAITDRNSVTWDVVMNSEMGDVVEHRNTAELVKLLIDTWSAWDIGNKNFFELKHAECKYEARLNAQVLADKMERLI